MRLLNHLRRLGILSAIGMTMIALPALAQSPSPGQPLDPLAPAPPAAEAPLPPQATPSPQPDSADSQIPPTAPVDGLLARLQQIQGEIQIAKGELELAELRKKLADLGAAAAPENPDFSNPLVAASYQQNAVPANTPYILKLSGIAGHMSATILMPDGSTLNVRPGLRLANGWRITTIDADGVSALDGNAVDVRLGISAGAAQPSADPTPSATTAGN